MTLSFCHKSTNICVEPPPLITNITFRSSMMKKKITYDDEPICELAVTMCSFQHVPAMNPALLG